jgi:hypothetical protein
MKQMKDLFSVPGWYVVLTLLVAMYQGIRGAWFQWLTAQHQNRAAANENPRISHIWSSGETIFLRCSADAILYFVCVAAGFLALFWAYRLLGQDLGGQGISGGAAAILVFLGVLGILGVTGQLPHLIQEGKFPK